MTNYYEGITGRTMPRRKVLAAGTGAAGLAATAMLLGGCGDDDDDDAPTSATATATATASASVAATATAEQPDVFIVANEMEPDDLFPYFGSYGSALVMRQIYETLLEPRMTLQPDGSTTLEYEPRLAESWEQVEPTRWRFKLRPGVTFHNGEPWDAAAAKFSFDTLANVEQAQGLKKSAILAGSGQSCEIVDEMTVDMVTKAPDAEFINIPVRIGFSAIPPKLVAEKGFESLRESPVGTGPYRFKSWARGQQIDLERNDEYWTTPPNMKALRFIARQEAAIRAQTVKTGEAHLAYNIGAEQAKTLEASVVGGGFQSSGVRLNNTISPTNDLKVRRALNLAIDRDAIIEGIFDGTSAAIGFFAFQPVNAPPFAYDPDEASKLIEEAGIKGDELEFVYGEARIPEEDQLVEIYKANWEAIGLKVKLTKLEAKQYNELGGKPFPEQPALYMETTSSGNFGDIASGLRDKYGCKGTGTFCDMDLEARYAALATLSGEERLTELQSIVDQLIQDEVSRIWVVGVRQVHGLAANVKTELPLNAYILFTDISWA